MATLNEVQSLIDAAEDLPKIGRACKTIAEHLQFQYFLLVFRIPLSLEKPYQLIYSNYPKGWRKHYDDNRYFSIDPVVRKALVSSVPFTWKDLRDGNAETEKLFAEAESFGLKHGVGVPVHGPNGSGALLSMSRGEQLPESADELRELLQTGLWCVTVLHDRLRTLLAQGALKFGKLTPREKQCLKLAASGLSAGLISQKIDISERTVIYYLSRAEEKLGVRTRQHAIARAIFLGELQPDCYPFLISQSHKVIDLGVS